MTALRVVKAPEHTSYREFIAALNARKARVDRLNDAVYRARRASWDAEAAVTAANTALGVAKTAMAVSAAAAIEGGGDGAGDASSVAEARRALHAAQDAKDIAVAALKHLEAELAAEDNSVDSQIAKLNHDRALADYLAPVVQRAAEKAIAADAEARKTRAVLEALRDARALSGAAGVLAKSFLGGGHLVPCSPLAAGSFPFNGGHVTDVPLPEGRAPEWRIALTKLRTDADVELPPV